MKRTSPVAVHCRGSPPTWGRGLKRKYIPHDVWVIFVAPHVGAWIETVYPDQVVQYSGRPPRGGVD